MYIMYAECLLLYGRIFADIPESIQTERKMKVSESGNSREELLEIVDTYLAEQSRRWEFIEEKGDGMYVYAENGDRYLDFFAGIAVSSAGNANKKVAKAIADQAANVIHASNYAYTLPMILLA